MAGEPKLNKLGGAAIAAAVFIELGLIVGVYLAKKDDRYKNAAAAMTLAAFMLLILMVCVKCVGAPSMFYSNSSNRPSEAEPLATPSSAAVRTEVRNAMRCE